MFSLPWFKSRSQPVMDSKYAAPELEAVLSKFTPVFEEEAVSEPICEIEANSEPLFESMIQTGETDHAPIGEPGEAIIQTSESTDQAPICEQGEPADQAILETSPLFETRADPQSIFDVRTSTDQTIEDSIINELLDWSKTEPFLSVPAPTCEQSNGELDSFKNWMEAFQHWTERPMEESFNPLLDSTELKLGSEETVVSLPIKLETECSEDCSCGADAPVDCVTAESSDSSSESAEDSTTLASESGEESDVDSEPDPPRREVVQIIQDSFFSFQNAPRLLMLFGFGMIAGQFLQMVAPYPA